jgi:hypothetical protein
MSANQYRETTDGAGDVEHMELEIASRRTPAPAHPAGAAEAGLINIREEGGARNTAPLTILSEEPCYPTTAPGGAEYREEGAIGTHQWEVHMSANQYREM